MAPQPKLERLLLDYSTCRIYKKLSVLNAADVHTPVSALGTGNHPQVLGSHVPEHAALACDRPERAGLPSLL